LYVTDLLIDIASSARQTKEKTALVKYDLLCKSQICLGHLVAPIHHTGK